MTDISPDNKPTNVGFYHCTRRPATEVAVQLAAKAYENGQRLLVKGEAETLEALDKLLWTMVPESFLPHARAGGAHDANQPVLLSDNLAPANGAKLLMLVGVGLPEGFERFERVLNLFDQGSDAHKRARNDWKALGGRDRVTRSYWQQTPKGWVEQAG